MNQNVISKDSISERVDEQYGVALVGAYRPSEKTSPSKLMRFVGIAGVSVASLMMVWFLFGLTGIIPSMIEIFGVPGLRFPAGIAISGLLAASIGFNDF